jgi:WD40 repeat protein
LAIVDMTTGQRVAILDGGDFVYDATWSANGDAVASADRDGHVRAWSTESQEPLTPPLPTSTGVEANAVALSGDGRRIAGGGWYATSVWVWQLPIRSHAQRSRSVRTRTDELWLEDGHLRWAGVVNGSVPTPCPTGRGSIAVDASRRFAFVSCWKGFTIADLEDGRSWYTPDAGGLWSPTRPFLAMDEGSDNLWIWSRDHGLRQAYDGSDFRGMVWSPDGHRVAARYAEGVVVIDAVTLERVTTIDTPPMRLHAWTTDLGLLGQDDAGTVIRVPLTGAEPTPVFHVGTDLRHIAASPDGSRLALAGHDGNLRVWDATREVFVGGVHGGDKAWRIAFTSDGRHIVTLGYYTNRTLVWTRDGDLVGQASPSMVDPPYVGAQFAELGGLEADARPIEDWLDLATLYSQQNVRDPTGTPPTPEDLQALWAKLRVLYPDDVGARDGEQTGTAGGP